MHTTTAQSHMHEHAHAHRPPNTDQKRGYGQRHGHGRHEQDVQLMYMRVQLFAGTTHTSVPRSRYACCVLFVLCLACCVGCVHPPCAVCLLTFHTACHGTSDVSRTPPSSRVERLTRASGTRRGWRDRKMAWHGRMAWHGSTHDMTRHIQSHIGE